MSIFGIHNRKTTLLWPEASGEAEHFMAILNKTIRASVIYDVAFYQLSNFSTKVPRSGELRTQKLKSHLVRTRSLE